MRGQFALFKHYIGCQQAIVGFNSISAILHAIVWSVELFSQIIATHVRGYSLANMERGKNKRFNLTNFLKKYLIAI